MDSLETEDHHPRYYGLLAGASAAGVSLSFGELVAGISETIPGLVLAVAERVVDLTPGDLVAAGIETAGTNDKPILLWGVSLAALAIGAILGDLHLRGHRRLGVAGFAVFGVLGGYAVARNPISPTAASWTWSITAAALGAATLAALNGRLRRTPAITSPEEPTDPRSSRRAFLAWSSGAGAVAVSAVGVGRIATGTSAAVVARQAVTLPTSPTTSGAVPTTSVEPVNALEGLSTYITPNSDFYRIDTALSVPQVDPSDWKLSFTGMIDRPFEITYDDILAMDLEDHIITLSCVSNDIGGSLVGNASWTGIPLETLLEQAGVQAGASQIVGRSTDDWTAGFPTEVIGDGRNALLAIGMNGEPLPIRHGFPARLVVAGLYGYVSAVKWIEEIHLTTWDDFDGYWVPRGWSKKGPMKTTSRIDVPRTGRRLAAGPAAIAGVAWAPTRGISAVEVSVDEGEWVPCELGESTTDETWVLWQTTWDAPLGRHTIRVRCYDGNSELQPEGPVDPRPDGAEGWHTVRVDVS